MGWEPITYCRECSEPFEVYMAPEDRICEGCRDAFCVDCPSPAKCSGSPICVGVGGFAPRLMALKGTP